MKTLKTKKSGRWGKEENIPPCVLKCAERLREDPGIDWTVSYIGKVEYLIAKLYEDPKHFDIVICEVLKKN